MKLIFVSGGSAGHLAPLVAVAHAVKEFQPNAEILMACSDRPDDAAYLKREGFDPALILKRPRMSLRLPFTLIQDIRMARAFLQKERPDVVFAKGAAVSVPLCYAARTLKIPIVTHESDAVMGNANRIISKWADVVCLGFGGEKSEERNPNDETSTNVSNMKNPKFEFASNFDLRSSKFVVTGNPLRPHITNGQKEEGLRITGLKGKKPVLLVIGGSQGAQAINDVIARNIDRLLSVCDIVHLTGRAKLTGITRDGYWSAEFVYEELPHLYALATAALSRAGAGAISELSENDIPSIFVPIRGLAHDHQMANATRAQENGDGIILLQSELDEKLFDVVQKFTSDPAYTQKIPKSDSSKLHAGASRRIAEILVQCIARSRERH